jgi:hypothetical protein
MQMKSPAPPLLPLPWWEDQRPTLGCCYLASPYRNPFHLRPLRIRGHQLLVTELSRHGISAVSPVLQLAHLDGLVSEDAILGLCLSILHRCDILLLMPGWRRSEGAMCEYKAALAVGKPIVDMEDARLLADPRWGGIISEISNLWEVN